MMEKNKATLVKYMRKGFNGDARLYRLEPGLEWTKYANEDGQYVETTRIVEHVIVSASVVPFSGPETYIFPADEEGKVLDWSELDGSFRGGLSHDRALAGAGYEIMEED